VSGKHNYPVELPWPPPWKYLTSDIAAKVNLGTLANQYTRKVYNVGRKEDLCPVTQFLTSAALAIDGRNGSFLRPDSLLVILVLADREDCSTQAPSYWQQQNVWGKVYINPEDRCYSSPSGSLYSVDHFVGLFGTAHTNGRIIVAITAATGTPKFANGPIGKYVLDVCKGIKPTVRMKEFHDKIGASENQRVAVRWIDSCSVTSLNFNDVAKLSQAILRIVKL
jgi:hypothetical protein